MQLNQTAVLIKNELRKFAQEILLEKVDELDKNRTFPAENLKRLAEMGILGALIPEKYEGAELDILSFIVGLEELSKVCPSTAFIVLVHNCLFSLPILKSNNQELKERYLKPAATGEIIGGFTEESTNDIAIKKVSDRYIINGKNPLLFNGSAQGPFIGLLPDSEKSGNTKLFICAEKGSSVKTSQNPQTLGFNAGGICEVEFNEHQVNTSEIIDNPGVLVDIIPLVRLGLSAISLGIAEGATDYAVKYARERIQFGELIIKFGMIREKLALMFTKIEMLKAIIYDTASDYESGKKRRSSAIIKYFAGKSAVEITTSAIQIYGGYGYMKDYPVERYFRDAQMVNVICGTPIELQEEIVRNSID